MLSIVDYGVGNLFSLVSSLKYIGVEAIVTSDSGELEKSDRLILPGVGAFSDAAEKLRKSGLDRVICSLAGEGRPLLGICLGMQMLFERSYEYGVHEGLGLIPGEVKPILPIIGGELKVPQIGWNSLDFPEGKSKSRLFKFIYEGDFVYFVHSYAAVGCEDSIIATTFYGAPLTAAVERNNVFGTQFHPEKSGEVGLDILRGFTEI